MSSRIYLSPPHISELEQSRVSDVFASNWIAPLGPEVEGFEHDICNTCQVTKASVVSSGTAAIHLALRLLGVGAGDFVIVQSFSFVASANPVRYVGAEPVFVDSEASSWNMCPKQLEIALEWCRKQGRPAKAVIIVDLYGVPAQYDKLEELCAKFDTPIIEDSAEALGSTFRQKPAGGFGKLGILSFNGNKIITTSGGGALLGNDASLIEKASYLASQAREPAPYYSHSEIGYNYRLSNVLAAIGRAQLSQLDQKVAARRNNFAAYKDALGSEGILFPEEPIDTYCNRWLTTVLFPEEVFKPGTADAVRVHLDSLNIESRPLWKPLHTQLLYKNCQYFGDGLADSLFQIGLCLPSGSSLTPSERTRVIDGVRAAISS
jgi:dTDP-4-amino-4,6-dideoxygalactose transaminase